jgi:hypothetical protein
LKTIEPPVEGRQGDGLKKDKETMKRRQFLKASLAGMTTAGCAAFPEPAFHPVPGQPHLLPHPEIVAQMREAYDAWWQEVRPLMVNEDAVYEGIAPYIKNYEELLKTKGIPEWIPPEF